MKIFYIAMYTEYNICLYLLYTAMLLPPLVMIETVFNTITLWWSPVSNDLQCGEVSYLVTITPAHGTLTRISDTSYKITELNYNTTYDITVLATSDIAGNGYPANIIVETISLQSMHESNLMLYFGQLATHAVVCNP